MMLLQPSLHGIQDWLSHPSIQHTVRYTELSPTQFRDFWRDCAIRPLGLLGLGVKSFWRRRGSFWLTYDY